MHAHVYAHAHIHTHAHTPETQSKKDVRETAYSISECRLMIRQEAEKWKFGITGLGLESTL